MSGERAPKRILVVDDDDVILGMCAIALKAKGYIVSTMKSGFGLTNRVSGRDGPAPDLVILDNYLPGLPGIGLLTLLAASPPADKVPVILYSSDPNVEREMLITGHIRCSFLLKGSILALIREVERMLK